ncbi:MAG: serine hydrolase domain-containing protein [Dehalococcoidia bacterium]
MNRNRFTRVALGLGGASIVVAAALTVACDSAPAPSSAESATVLPREAFQAILDRRVAEGVPGIVLRVETKDGEVWSGAAGVAALDGPPMMPTARLPIFSVAKMAVATAALSLVEDGVIDLEDPIGKWVDAATIADLPNADRLTIRHLINQTGGVRDYWDDDFTAAVVADTGRQWAPEELVAHAAAGAPAGSPDDGDADYANTNYVLLGLVIEGATNSPLSAVLRDRVFEPLEMSQTASWEEATLRPQANGYIEDGGELVDVTGVDLSLSWAAGGLVSNAEDVATLTKASVLGGGVLSDETHTSVMTTFTPWNEGLEYGLGLMRVTAFGSPTYGHMGDGPGYTSLSLYDPAAGVGVVVLMNVTAEEARMQTYLEVMQALGLYDQLEE